MVRSATTTVAGHRTRPRRPPTRSPSTDVVDGLHLASVRAGRGGEPLLLIHGYPETKRIWWRNIEPLAAAGFEVIVADLRGLRGTAASRPPTPTTSSATGSTCTR